MSLSCLGFVSYLDAQREELVQELDCFVKISLFFVNMTYLLIALSLLSFVLCSLGSLKAFLEKIKRLFKVILVLELDRNYLVDSH